MCLWLARAGCMALSPGPTTREHIFPRELWRSVVHITMIHHFVDAPLKVILILLHSKDKHLAYQRSVQCQRRTHIIGVPDNVLFLLKRQYTQKHRTGVEQAINAEYGEQEPKEGNKTMQYKRKKQHEGQRD